MQSRDPAFLRSLEEEQQPQPCLVFLLFTCVATNSILSKISGKLSPLNIELLKVSWLYEMQLSNQIWGHSEYGADLFFELKLVSPFNSVESWLV